MINMPNLTQMVPNSPANVDLVSSAPCCTRPPPPAWSFTSLVRLPEDKRTGETKLASRVQRAGSELFWMVREKPPPQQKIPIHSVGFQRLMEKSGMFPLCGGETPDRRRAPHPLPPRVEMR